VLVELKLELDGLPVTQVFSGGKPVTQLFALLRDISLVGKQDSGRSSPTDIRT